MRRLKDPLFVENWPNLKWTDEDKPVLVLDGAFHRVRYLAQPVSGHAAYVVGITERELPKLTSLLDVESLHFYELKVVELAPLSAIQRLRHLRIHWNAKLTSLDAFGALARLETLALIDTPKASDLSPIRNLTDLSAFLFSGGFWKENHAISLEPIASLPKLAELWLANLKVKSGGLRPLAKCRALETLTVSNQFETEDYAYLSVALPNVQCSYFAPWVRVDPIEGKDIRIVGRRKPMLNSELDRAKIAKYEEAFRRLQAQFASQTAS